MEFYQFDTPLGLMALGEEAHTIVRLYLPNTPTPRLMPHATPLLEEGAKQILEYLHRQRCTFDLPLRPRGTPFQQKVWQALQDIPFGERRTYRDIAQAVDCPRGFQAVGQANRKNPIPILIPCHRVTGVSGILRGYAGGTELQKALLELEGTALVNKVFH